MKRLLPFCLVLALAACGTASVKSVAIACKKEPRAFAREAREILTKNDYKVLEIDELTGFIKAFRQEYDLLFGDKPIVVSPKVIELAPSADSVKAIIYSVGRDGKTPVRYWDERATDEFEKTSYMPLLNALKDLCR
ncbi:MAG: hypothetical protein NZM06_05465 [Chloroherpetonaceae bacterium]|nr:hypothetical protein [Chloroherpetonaceae bacterium]MDW8438073.1 hypothetical protein [Chloroherpetonaceae bacterium]